MKIALLISLLLLIGCSKNQKQTQKQEENEKFVSFESPIHFQFDPKLETAKIIAQFENQSVMFKDVLKDQLALLRLKEQINQEIVFIGYYWALGELENSKSNNAKTVSLNYFIEKPSLSIDNLLSDYNLRKSDQIKVSFETHDNKNQAFSINKRAYSIDDVAKSHLPLAKNRKKYFNSLLRIVEDKVSRFLLIREADMRKISVNEYVEKEIFSGGKISPEQINLYAQQNNIPLNQIDSVMQEKLRKIIKAQSESKAIIAHAAKILGDRAVQISIRPINVKVHGIDIPEGAPTLGQGPLKIIVISNSMCEECRRIEPELISLVENSMKQIQLQYLFHFREDNARIQMVSEAAMCVHDQDPELFWPFHKRTHQESFDGQERKIKKIAQEMKIDFKEFYDCFLARKFKEPIKKQISAVETLGYLDLPTVIIKDHLVAPPIVQKDLIDLINSSASQKNESQTSRAWWSWFASFFN